jgi:Type VI secretion system protein DotU
MTLLDLCEPLFLSVCKTNRAKRSGANLRESRAELEKIFAQMAAQAKPDRDLAGQYAQLEPVLRQFAGFPCPSDKQEFFAQLDATLIDQTRAATYRLAIFYICLGLGFAAGHEKDPQFVEEKARRVYDRVREFLEYLDQKKKLCAAAYQQTNRRVLQRPVGRRLAGLGVAAAVLILIALAVNAVLYLDRTRGLNQMIDSVLSHDAQPPAKS